MNEICNRRRNLKAKLRRRRRVYAAWTSLAHPSITEIFARSGVDFVGIDIEHSTISQEQARQIIAACQGNGILCLPRIASHNMEMIKRLLDSGADGIIVPMVSEPQEVERLISWCKYPPRGQRRYGISRAQAYGFDFDEYANGWNESSVLIIQIESVQGVQNIDKLLAFEDVDGAMIGPYDLSGSMNIPGRIDDPRVTRAARKVIAACSEFHKACGTQIIEPDVKNIRKAFASGYTFTVLASDVFILWKWAARTNGLISMSRTPISG